MNYLSQSNSFLPLKAVVMFVIIWPCYLLQASSGIQKGFFYSHLMQWMSSTKRSDKHKLQWWGAVIGTILFCSSEVACRAYTKSYFLVFLLDILIFIYPRIRALWPYSTRTYITWFFLESTLGSSYIQLLLITSLFVNCLVWTGTIYYSFSLLLSKILYKKN